MKNRKTGFKPTIWKLRDLRHGPAQFRIVHRELYKKAARCHNRAGQPMRVNTVYAQGRVIKELTLLTAD